MKRIFLVIIVLAVGLLVVTPAADAQYFGKYCFKFDVFSDTYVLRVGTFGDVYQIVGHNSGAAPWVVPIDGSGYISGSSFYANLTEMYLPGGAYAVHGFQLNLSTMTGYDWGIYYTENGTLLGSVPQDPFHLINCPQENEPVQDQPTTSNSKMSQFR